jgi:hypothetical protein
MPTLTANANTTGFLSNDFPHNPPRLYVTAEDDVFDERTLQEWQDEGFHVRYLPMNEGGTDYGDKLDQLSRIGLGVGETFAIIGKYPYQKPSRDCCCSMSPGGKQRRRRTPPVDAAVLL